VIDEGSKDRGRRARIRERANSRVSVHSRPREMIQAAPEQEEEEEEEEEARALLDDVSLSRLRTGIRTLLA